MTHQQTPTNNFENLIYMGSIEGARFFDLHEVLAATDLNFSTTRAILAGWLSDARAVPDAPGLRQLDCGALVRVNDLMQALTSLDEFTSAPDKFARGLSPYPRRGPEARISELLRRIMRRKNDDDDDPPPCPAGVRPRGNGPILETAPQEALIEAAA
jgi:hypothetical protein